MVNLFCLFANAYACVCVSECLYMCVCVLLLCLKHARTHTQNILTQHISIKVQHIMQAYNDEDDGGDVCCIYIVVAVLIVLIIPLDYYYYAIILLLLLLQHTWICMCVLCVVHKISIVVNNSSIINTNSRFSRYCFGCCFCCCCCCCCCCQHF